MAIVETTKSINMYPQLDNTMKQKTSAVINEKETISKSLSKYIATLDYTDNILFYQ